MEVNLTPGEQTLRLLTVRAPSANLAPEVLVYESEKTSEEKKARGIKRRSPESLTLFLKPAQIYELHRTRSGPAANTGEANARVETGRWYRLGDGGVQLSRAAGVFTRLDKEGETLRARGGTVFRPVERPLPDTPRELTGMYRYLADAALFQDCASGERFRVERGEGARLVQKAYLGKVRVAGDPLRMTIRVQPVPTPVDVEGNLPTLAVETLLRVEDGICPPMADSTATLLPGMQPVPLPEQLNRALVGKRWTLRYLDAKEARRFDNQPEPHLVFRSASATRGTLSGSDGCNALAGHYGIEPDALRFSGLAATMRLCPEGEAQAQAFNAALARTSAWRLAGSVLELLDRDQVLAVLEAVEL